MGSTFSTNSATTSAITLAMVEEMCAEFHRNRKPMLKEVLLWHLPTAWKIVDGFDVYFIYPLFMVVNLNRILAESNPKPDDCSVFWHSTAIIEDSQRALELFWKHIFTAEEIQL